MDRPKNGYAARKCSVLQPVTDRQLSAFLKSRKGGDEFLRRLAESLRQAWCRIQELEGEPPKENLQEERDWQTCERVLVVSETDGTVEVFAESWVAVRHVEVKPWESRDDKVWDLGAEWRRLDEQPKSKALIVPQIRSDLDDRALVDLLRWEKRSAAMKELLDLIRSRP